MRCLAIIDHKWRDRGFSEFQSKVIHRTGEDYIVLCIICPDKSDIKNVVNFIEQAFKDKCEDSKKEDTIILFHEPQRIWYERADDYFKWIREHSFFSKKFSGGTHWVYDEIIAKMGDWDDLLPDNLPDWENIKKKFYPNFLEQIVSFLLPLHLSLQAFFGISRDKKGNFIKIGDSLKNNHFSLTTFPNFNAFLLVKEAQYDFFAEIGGRLGYSNPAAQNLPMEDQPFLNFVEKMFADYSDLYETSFKDRGNKKINGKEIKQKIEQVFSNEGGGTLRILCAILANINDDGINNSLPQDDKFLGDEVGKHKRRIQASKEILSKYEECGGWFKRQPHSKWPTDLAGSGDEPGDSYGNLVEQINEWNKDGKSAKKVIRQIDNLVFYLGQIIDLYSDYLPLKRTMGRLFKDVEESVCIRRAEPESKNYFTTADTVVNYGFKPSYSYVPCIIRWKFPLHLYSLGKKIAQSSREKKEYRKNLLEEILKSQILDKLYPMVPHHVGDEDKQGDKKVFDKILYYFKENIPADDIETIHFKSWLDLLKKLMEENQEESREKLVENFNYFSPGENAAQIREDFAKTIETRILPGIRRGKAFFKVLVLDDFFSLHLPVFLAAEQMLTGEKSRVPIIHFEFECIPGKAKERCKKEDFDLILLDISFGCLDQSNRDEKKEGEEGEKEISHPLANDMARWANEQDPKIPVIIFSRYKEIPYYEGLLGNVIGAVLKEVLRNEISAVDDKKTAVRDHLIKPLLKALFRYYDVKVFSVSSGKGQIILRCSPASPLKRIGIYEVVENIFDMAVNIDRLVLGANALTAGKAKTDKPGQEENEIFTEILKIKEDEKESLENHMLIPFITEANKLRIFIMGRLPEFMNETRYMKPISDRFKIYGHIDQELNFSGRKRVEFDSEFINYEILIVTLERSKDDYCEKWEGLGKKDFVTALDKDMEYIVVPVFSKMSLLDIIGPIMIGPSSSHTAGANRIARLARNFAQLLIEQDSAPALIEVEMLNSFSSTGEGHGSDRAIAAGLLGLKQYSKLLPDTLNEPGKNKNNQIKSKNDFKNSLSPVEFAAEEPGYIKINGRSVKVRFTWNDKRDTDIHNNSLRFKYFMHEEDDREANFVFTARSWGGGNVQVSSIKKGNDEYIDVLVGKTFKPFCFKDDSLDKIKEHFNGKQDIILSIEPGKNKTVSLKGIYDPPLAEIEDALDELGEGFLPTPGKLKAKIDENFIPDFISIDDLEEASEGSSLWEIAVGYEVWSRKEESSMTPGDIIDVFYNYSRLMKKIAEESIEPKSLSHSYTDYEYELARQLKEGIHIIPELLSQKALEYAIGINEVNAKMNGLVLAAPTAGACGIIPGVLKSLHNYLVKKKSKKMSKDEVDILLTKGLLVSALIGLVITNIVPPAGATHGCQAEIGTGGAMAASLAAYVLAKSDQPNMGEKVTAEFCTQAAAISLKNSLGLVCDPLEGKVEVPCIKRAGFKAAESIKVAFLVINRIISEVFPSNVVRTMKEIGDNMLTIYKETSRAGLATTISSRSKKRLK